jgi:very-short-patch-repair endonuclease
MTPAERLLWRHVRNRRLGGPKFRRQHPLGRFIADFYCAAQRLVVEIDGDALAGQTEYDAVRTEVLEERGYRVIRFRNEEVLRDVAGVLSAIQDACMGARGMDRSG